MKSNIGVLGYGEDALTFWALTNKLDEILKRVGAPNDPPPRIFYRPSFGRGDKANFGEFDFMILASKTLWLGESKWFKSSQVNKDGTFKLDRAQERRHKIFEIYIGAWSFGCHSTWGDFEERVNKELHTAKMGKSAPGEDTGLAENLRDILGKIGEFCSGRPDIKNLLLYFRKEGEEPEEIVRVTVDGNESDDFFDAKVSLNCTAALCGVFIDLAQKSGGS